jgi:hypothetical protein
VIAVPPSFTLVNTGDRYQDDDLARRLGLDADGSRDAVRDGMSPVAALTRREREALRLMSRHAASIDKLASQCPGSYLVAGSMVLTAYALATAQRAQEAADVLLRGAGGPQLPDIQLVDRAYGYELLVTAALSLGDIYRRLAISSRTALAAHWSARPDQ